MLGRGSQVKIRGQQNNSKSYEYHLSSGTEAGQFLVNLARSELFGRLYEGETGVDHTIGVGDCGRGILQQKRRAGSRCRIEQR